MRVLKLAPRLFSEEVKEVMNSQKSVRDFRDYQILYFVDLHKGIKSKEIASMLGITSNKVFKTVEKYNSLGIDWKCAKPWGGRREARCLMSLEEEAVFLKSIEEDALTGKIVTYKQIKSKLEIKLDKEVSDDYIWDMFKRHGWRKKVPRKSHPHSDKAAQEEYKKNFRNYWLPKN
jgi:transposase